MILLLFKPYKVNFLLISKMDNVAVRKKEQCPGVPVGPLYCVDVTFDAYITRSCDF